MYIKVETKVMRDDVAAIAKALKDMPSYVKNGEIMSFSRAGKTTRAKITLAKGARVADERQCWP